MAKEKLVRYGVQLPEQPAVHAELTRLLIEESIPVKFMLTVRFAGSTVIQFLAPRSARLTRGLKRIAIAVTQSPVVAMKMPRNRAALDRFAQSLTTRGINIVALDSSEEGPYSRFVLAVDQSPEALELIRDLGFRRGAAGS